MATERIKQLANNVLARKHLGINEAMESVLGEYTKENANVYNDVFEEVENILHPHGQGEDAVHCDFYFRKGLTSVSPFVIVLSMRRNALTL